MFNKMKISLSSCDITETIRNIALINEILLDLKLNDMVCLYLNNLDFLFKEVLNNTHHLTSPNGVFFIWIGDIPTSSLTYIDVWINSISNEKISLWYDSQFLLAGKLRKIIHSTYKLNNKDSKDVIQIQNYVFKEIKESMMNNNLSGDDAIIDFVYKLDKGICITLKEKYNAIKRRYKHIGSYIDLVDINYFIKDVFLSNFYYDCYIMEILLRYNLAAASDITRLSILYRYGGTYIDVDTLPSLEHVFKRTNETLGNNILNKNIIDVFKSQLYIEKIKNNNIVKVDLLKATKKLYPALREINKYLPDLLIEDIEKLKVENLYEKHSIKKIDANLFSMSANKNSIGEFNNNIISAHSNSKSIKIVLNEMKKRYNYISEHGFDLLNSSTASLGKNDYYNRLKNYRFDAIDNDDYVTLITSGPSLLLEVSIGLSYDILKMDYSTNQVSLSYALQTPHLGIGYTDQTMYTSDHIKSSWMKNKELEDTMV
ncbi:hypothetical protein PBPRA0243 [Photobacterium profundum SS9]|uniref:GT44 domain-containing protein n=2 Tax=Photobacterium profundum TaxID=74109 RepID=Q6LVJ3_PHOPR|nr:hypothetical protein PBPRA0243 [Photobacterium profundum SS9]